MSFCFEINPSEVFFRPGRKAPSITNELGRVFINQPRPRIKFIEDLGDIKIVKATYYLAESVKSVEYISQSTPYGIAYSILTDTTQSRYVESIEEVMIEHRYPRHEYLSIIPNMKDILAVLDRISILETAEVISQDGRFFLNLTGAQWER